MRRLRKNAQDTRGTCIHVDVAPVFHDHFLRERKQCLADILGDGPGDRSHGAHTGRLPGLQHVPHDTGCIFIQRQGTQGRVKGIVFRGITADHPASRV